MIYLLVGLITLQIVLIYVLFFVRRRQILTIEQLGPVFATIRDNHKHLKIIYNRLNRKRGEESDSVFTFEFPEEPIQKRIDYWGKTNSDQHKAIQAMLISFKESFIFGEADTVTIGISRKDSKNEKTD